MKQRYGKYQNTYLPSRKKWGTHTRMKCKVYYMSTLQKFFTTVSVFIKASYTCSIMHNKSFHNSNNFF